jgi:hypothetical protein
VTFVTVACLSNFTGALLLDKAGRKPLLRKKTTISPDPIRYLLVQQVVETYSSSVAGLIGSMLAVSLETAMIARFAGTTNRAGLSMGVFFSYCFIVFYGSGLDVVVYVYCSKSSS